MPWGERHILPGAGRPRDEALRADYKRLIAIRRAHKALSRGVHTGLSTDGDLLVFLRWDEASGDAVVVAVNRGAAPAAAGFVAPAEWGDRPVRDVWNGEPVSRTGNRIEAAVAPRGSRILAAEHPPDQGLKDAKDIKDTKDAKEARAFFVLDVLERPFRPSPLYTSAERERQRGPASPLRKKVRPVRR
jgi:hypothetical protein